MADGRAQGRYQVMKTKREPYLRRARKASELTIASLIPPDGFDGTAELYTPYQGVGAQGIRTTSAKLTTAILPANTPYFRMKPDEKTLDELKGKQKGVRTDTEKKLSKYERIVTGEIEASGDRSTIDEMTKHILVAGNVCLDTTETKTRLFKLDSYVCRRAPRGDVVEAILMEGITYSTAPDAVKPLLSNSKPEDDNIIYVYTHIELRNGFYEVYQEVVGKRIPGTKAKYKLEDMPYLFLRFARIDGEDYGRGFVEEVYGDLASLEALTEAIVQGAAAAAKVIFLVNPNGTTRVKALRDTKNLGFAEGNSADVTVLHLDKQADFAIAERMSQRIENRLQEQFMLHSSVARDAERVTAEEVRTLANELDVGLSGMYSILAVEFQLPYTKRKISLLTASGKVPKLPKDVVSPVIITGMQALGRSQDLERLRAFMRELKENLGEQRAAEVINTRVYADRLATALQVDTDELIKDEETIAEERQKAQGQGLMQQAAPGVIQEMVKNGQAGQLAEQAAAGAGAGPPAQGPQG